MTLKRGACWYVVHTYHGGECFYILKIAADATSYDRKTLRVFLDYESSSSLNTITVYLTGFFPSLDWDWTELSSTKFKTLITYVPSFKYTSP